MTPLTISENITNMTLEIPITKVSQHKWVLRHFDFINGIFYLIFGESFVKRI